VKTMKNSVTGLAAFLAVGWLATVWTAEAVAVSPTNAATASTNVVQQTMCPVLKGNPIDKSIYVDYQGKRIYTCCAMCQKTVKKNPAKFVKMLEAEGITLDKAEPAAKSGKN
jgi:hypothetical protein